MKLQNGVILVVGFLFAGCKKDVVDELTGKYVGSVSYESVYGTDAYSAKFRVLKKDVSSFDIVSENVFNGEEADLSKTFAYREDGDYSVIRTDGYVESFSARFPTKDSLVVWISRWSSAGHGGTMTQGATWTFKGKK